MRTLFSRLTLQELLQLHLCVILELKPILLLALLDLIDQSLLTINLFNQLVLQVDHAAFELFQLETILALDLLFGDIKHLCKVTLQHFNALTLLSDDSLQAILTCPEALLQLVHLVLVVVPLLGDLVEVFRHLATYLAEDAFDIIH